MCRSKVPERTRVPETEMVQERKSRGRVQETTSRLALSWCVCERVRLWDNSNARFRIPFSRLLRSSVQGGPDVIRKEAWPYRTISGVRLCWELEESKEPKGPNVKGP